MEGDDDKGGVMEMPYYDSEKEHDCGCGGGESMSPQSMIPMLMAAISELMGKDADEDIEVKAGSASNASSSTPPISTCTPSSVTSDLIW